MERMEDVIEDKGNGLILILHRSPGTGKTLMAGKGVGFSAMFY
jgi:hypothetical protein